MNAINKLAEYFARFPGIGPRQSKRFVYFLLKQPPSFLNELASLLQELKKGVGICKSCQRYFTLGAQKSAICPICNDTNRNSDLLLVVEKDIDIDNIERGKLYDGCYFSLGGTLPILEKNPEQRIHIDELRARIDKGTFKEIILAFSATPEGDNTAQYVRDQLETAATKKKFKVSTLGRGLSTGSELEYADAETIKNAINNRG